jgi:hypothetical protein
VTGEIIAVEGSEGKLPRAVLRNILRDCDSKQFEIGAVQLNKRVAGAERMLPARRDGKSQTRIVRTHGLEIMAGEHQVVDAFH